MTEIHAIVAEDGTVTGAFGGPQPDGAPNYEVMDDSDARWTAWLSVLSAAQARMVESTHFTPTDYQMARGHEDLVALLIAKGVIAPSDIGAPALANLNARRVLRGEAALGG